MQIGTFCLETPEHFVLRIIHAGGKNDSALIVAREALDVAQKSRNTTAIVGINSSMGVYLRTMGKTDEALRHYNEAMKLCTTAEFKAKADEDARQEAAALYLNLATLHIDMQHKKEAMYYAGLSVDWTQKCADKAFKAQMLSQNGLMFLMAGDNNKAADMLTRSYGYAMELGQTDAAMSAAAYMVATADRLGDRRGGRHVARTVPHAGAQGGIYDDARCLLSDIVQH